MSFGPQLDITWGLRRRRLRDFHCSWLSGNAGASLDHIYIRRRKARVTCKLSCICMHIVELMGYRSKGFAGKAFTLWSLADADCRVFQYPASWCLWHRCAAWLYRCVWLSNLFKGVTHWLGCYFKVSYRLENRKRDQLYGKPQRNMRVNTHELADKVCFVCDIDRFTENLLDL